MTCQSSSKKPGAKNARAVRSFVEGVLEAPAPIGPGTELSVLTYPAATRQYSLTVGRLEEWVGHGLPELQPSEASARLPF